uniref:Transmembrane protein n=1 Tax=Mycena chlorophos TaxID=658473 RepID=A0ABQ0L3X5_MYCCL|nr:predicted protein [Mycena chlorophos]
MKLSPLPLILAGATLASASPLRVIVSQAVGQADGALGLGQPIYIPASNAVPMPIRHSAGAVAKTEAFFASLGFAPSGNSEGTGATMTRIQVISFSFTEFRASRQQLAAERVAAGRQASFWEEFEERMMYLPPWVAGVVAFVFGCSLGVLIRALFVVAFHVLRAVFYTRSSSPATVTDYYYFEVDEDQDAEEVLVAPPVYTVAEVVEKCSMQYLCHEPSMTSVAPSRRPFGTGNGLRSFALFASRTLVLPSAFLGAGVGGMYAVLLRCSRKDPISSSLSLNQVWALNSGVATTRPAEETRSWAQSASLEPRQAAYYISCSTPPELRDAAYIYRSAPARASTTLYPTLSAFPTHSMADVASFTATHPPALKVGGKRFSISSKQHRGHHAPCVIMLHPPSSQARVLQTTAPDDGDEAAAPAFDDYPRPTSDAPHNTHPRNSSPPPLFNEAPSKLPHEKQSPRLRIASLSKGYTLKGYGPGAGIQGRIAQPLKEMRV